MPVFRDLTGHRFGRLVAIGRCGTSPAGNAIWLCQCDCGSETKVLGLDLTRNHTSSCGCLRNELSAIRCTKHSKSRTRLHTIWKAMNQRCCNPANKEYHRYGGRGITVCDEWQNDFQVFYDWAIANGYDGNAPRGQCTIDRTDNDKGYNPDNCRWVDMKTQSNNRSNNRHKKGE